MPRDIKKTQPVPQPSLALSLFLTHAHTHTPITFRLKALGCVCSRMLDYVCVGMCLCVYFMEDLQWQWQPAKPVSDHRKVFLSVSVWPFEETVKVIEDTSLWFRHCVNYKSQSCRVCRAEGRGMFSESVKGLLKSLTNTLVFITVVTSTIFLSFFPLSHSPCLYWSHVQSHVQAVFLWVENALRFISIVTTVTENTFKLSFLSY